MNITADVRDTRMQGSPIVPNCKIWKHKGKYFTTIDNKVVEVRKGNMLGWATIPGVIKRGVN